MLMTLAVLGLVITTLYNVLELNKRRMTPSEFFAWQTGLFTLSLFLIFPDESQEIANILGFELLSNLILTALILILLYLNRTLSRELSQLKKKFEKLVQAIAINDKK